MADQKISQLTEVTNPNPNDVIPIVNGSETKKITVANLAVAGSSGTSGSNGSSGTSGNNGTSGTSGSNGSDGTSGSNGSSGTSGINGTSGTSGVNGTSGSSGTSGSNGSSGTSGSNGSSGTSGSNGSSGTSGVNGTSGTSGYVDNDWLYFTPSTVTIPSTGNNFILSGTTTSNGSVSYNQSTGIITLAANKTYKLNASFALANNINNAETQYQWINVTTSNTLIGNLAGVIVVNSNATAAWQPLAEAIIVTTGTTQVALRSTFSNSTGGFSTSQCFMMVTQINGWSGTSGTSGSNGSSGTSGSNGSSGTSGVVSYTGLITTGSISTTQNITGSVIISGSMNIITTTLQVGTGSGDEGGEILLAKSQTNNSLTGSGITIDSYQNRLRIFEQGGGARGVYLDLSKAPAGVSGELTCKSSGIVNAGTFVTLDNIKATLTSSGNRGLSVATVSGTVTGFISAHYQGIGGSSGSNASSTSLSTSATTSMFSWNFTGQGDTSTYILRDDTNDRVYRIILIIGGTYLNNFISIERLH
jgi:hypothetical protein